MAENPVALANSMKVRQNKPRFMPLQALSRLLFLLAVVLFTQVPRVARAQSDDSRDGYVGHNLLNEKIEPQSARRHSILGGILLYIPNRVLDFLDIFRFRVRVGPGVAVGARATEVLDGFLGSYAAVYAGLPGPRMSRVLPLPAGLESRAGVEVSVVDASTGGGFGPNYSPTEFGLGGQALILGFDAGIDPMEILDFAAGIVAIDLRDDDL